MRWLRHLLDRVRVNDGVRFEVWKHTQDRRAPEQKARYAAIEDVRRARRWDSMFEHCDKLHDSHVTRYHVAKYEALARKGSNVIEFKRRAAG